MRSVRGGVATLGGDPSAAGVADSDPRWRRRIVAGEWILLLFPFMDALRSSDWAANTHMLTVIDYRGALAINETFLFEGKVYQPMLFCIGVVLLFAKESGRRPRRLDWVRRWGILCSYVTFLLSIAPILFIIALVTVGIEALFISMPLKYQPTITPWFVNVTYAYLHFGPQPKTVAYLVLVGFSSITILLACVPLFDALRSSGPKLFAAIIVTPLGMFAVAHLAQAVWYCIDSSRVNSEIFAAYRWYFRSELLPTSIAELLDITRFSFVSTWVEIVKWGIVLTIAIWLSIAQMMARRPLRTPALQTPA